MRKLLLILAFLLPSVACAGGLTLEKYESLHDRKETDIYITGAYYDIMWSNAHQAITDEIMLYCSPEAIAMTENTCVAPKGHVSPSHPRSNGK